MANQVGTAGIHPLSGYTVLGVVIIYDTPSNHRDGRMRKFELECLAPSATTGEYPGAFPPNVDLAIRGLVIGNVLHLFSGSSLIGQERIDINHRNATQNINVKEFIATDDREWDWIILDPPYDITRVSKTLNGYGLSGSLAADVIFRRKVLRYFQNHTDNVLWLDICAPIIKGFYRKKLWLVLTGGYQTVRVLSWLKREMKPLL